MSPDLDVVSQLYKQNFLVINEKIHLKQGQKKKREKRQNSVLLLVSVFYSQFHPVGVFFSVRNSPDTSDKR